MFETGMVLLALSIVGYVLVGAGLGIAAIVQISNLRRSVRKLEKTVGALQVDAPEAMVKVATSKPVSDRPAEMSQPVRPKPTPPKSRPPKVRKQFDLERNLTSKWMVWTGGLALALGAIFLVIYAVETFSFRPELRVGAGFGLAVLLLGLGEWTRRHEAMSNRIGFGSNYVPQALAAASVIAFFASVYAGYALYGLFSVPVAFLLLATVAFGAVALALLQGPFVAILGLLGGYATPLLIANNEPWALFPYLFALTAACVFLVRYVGAWWLSWSALVGSLGWVVLWLLSHLFVTSSAQDGLPLGLFLIATAALFQTVRAPITQPSDTKRTGEKTSEKTSEKTNWRQALKHMPIAIAWIASLTAALLMVWLVHAGNWGLVSMSLMAALVIWFFAYGLWENEIFDGLALLGLAIAAFTLGAWYQPLPTIWVPGRTIPAALVPFLGWAITYGTFFGVAGFWALGRGRRPGIWAILSAAGPVIFLILAYWRITAFQTAFMWTPVALLLALLGIVVTRYLERYPTRHQADFVLGVYAAATVTATSLALTMALNEAWLTVALSAELPVLAWIAGRRRIRALAPIAAGVGLVVLIRLIPNVYVLDYQLAGDLGVPWVIYGYGLPAIAFLLARHLFSDISAWSKVKLGPAGADQWIRSVFEAGGIAFGVIMVSFLIRIAFEGRIDAPSYSFAEQGLQQAAWAGMAALLWAVNRRHLGVPAWGWRILLTFAAGHAIWGPLLNNNPLWSPTPVGGTPLFNLLFLAYGVPACFAFFFAHVWRTEEKSGHARAFDIGGLVFLFVYLMLEVRRFHQGAILSNPGLPDAELYTYSAVLLVSALALLAIGLWRGRPGPRYASLVFMLATVLKVFLVDLTELGGLMRVASFLGLGFALIGLGWLYQRFVLPAGKAEPETE